ncbi:putative phage holin [Gordonia soli]|uniref:Uncharacterized protein n=1 Tax=Gordonia soli NBRC 108243 TaxID=1223545 RepID=M0QS26_9ACTN|nr:hypothetical protein [Gordonia soli]GAC70712.1 hypothetical protein GS4_39_00430 [Gordonia soli NBRC 108243]
MTAKMIADIAICVLAFEQLVFTVQYVVKSPWWASNLGKVYALKSTLWTLVVLQVAVSVSTGSEYPGRHYVRLVIYVGGAVAMVWLWLMLRRYQEEGREARARAGDTRTQRQLWADTLREWAGRK